MPPDVVEHVARAIANAHKVKRVGADPDLFWRVLDDDERARYRSLAVAAIEAYVEAVAERRIGD